MQIETADGKVQTVLVDPAALDEARNNAMLQAQTMDTTGLTMTKVGTQYQITRSGVLLGTVERQGGNAVATAYENGEMVKRVTMELPQMETAPLGRPAIDMQVADNCLFWLLYWLASVTLLAGCATGLACAGAILNLISATDTYMTKCPEHFQAR